MLYPPPKSDSLLLKWYQLWSSPSGRGDGNTPCDAEKHWGKLGHGFSLLKNYTEEFWCFFVLPNVGSTLRNPAQILNHLKAIINMYKSSK